MLKYKKQNFKKYFLNQVLLCSKFSKQIKNTSYTNVKLPIILKLYLKIVNFQTIQESKVLFQLETSIQL